MGFLRTWAIIVKYRIMIVALVVTAVLATVIILYFVPPIYTATAKVMLVPNDASVLAARVAGAVIPTTLDPAHSLSQTYGEIITSRDMAKRIVADIYKEIPQPAPAEGLAVLREWISKALSWISSTLQYGEYKEPSQEEATIDGVARSLFVQQSRESFVLLIKSDTSNPYLSALIANQAAKAFVQFGRDTANQESRSQRQFVEGQLAQASKRLADAREAVRKFREEDGHIALDLETNLRITDLVAAEKALDDLNSSIKEQEARQKQTQDQRDQQEAQATDKSKTTTSSNTSESTNQRTAGQSGGQGVDESLASSQSNTVTTTVNQETTAANPVQRSLDSELLAQERDLAGLYSRKQSLYGEIARLRAALTSVPEQQSKLADLVLEQSLAEDLFTKLQGQLEDAKAAEAHQVEPIKMVDEAVPPDYPRSPVRLLYFGVAFVAALLIGLIAAFTLENIADLRRRRQQASQPEVDT